MKYQKSVIIDVPIDRIVEIFEDPEHIKQWQPGLQKIEPISGNPGTEGARTRLVYQIGKRSFEIQETILNKSLPHDLTIRYQAKGVRNTVQNTFESLNPYATRWITENEFKFSGLMKLMGFFMSKAFKKQTEKHMHLFKAYAENQAG